MNSLRQCGWVILPEPLDALRTRTSAKWTTYPPDVLPLFVAETDFALAEPIASALHDAIRRSDTGYAMPGPALPDAFAAFAERRFGWDVDPAQVRTTADVSMGIVEVLRRAISPGDGVVINPPVYQPFFDLIPEAGGRAIEVPMLRTESAWALDLGALEAAFAEGARAFLLCNPHNPLGHPHERAELEQVAELAARYGVTVVSDEIHAPLVHRDGRYTPFLTVSDAAREHGVAITSASKGWNLAGLKCAVMVTASRRLDALVGGMYQEVFWRTSILGLQASIAAFRHGEPWLDGVLDTLQANRRLLTDLLAAELPSARYREPRASYLAWLDLTALGWGDDPSVVILEHARVALVPGPSFGQGGAGHARLNFGCSANVLRDAVGRIAAVK